MRDGLADVDPEAQNLGRIVVPSGLSMHGAFSVNRVRFAVLIDANDHDKVIKTALALGVGIEVEGLGFCDLQDLAISARLDFKSHQTTGDDSLNDVPENEGPVPASPGGFGVADDVSREPICYDVLRDAAGRSEVGRRIGAGFEVERCHKNCLRANTNKCKPRVMEKFHAH